MKDTTEMAAGESTVKDTTETAASQQEESEKGVTGKQAVPVQQGTTSDSTASTQPEQVSVRRWEPFAIFDELQQDMARLWNHMLPRSRWPMSEPLRASGQLASWRPTTDVYEEDNQLVVKAELPGVKKEDITVELDRGSLVIRGERQDRHSRAERSTGSFYRRLPVPDGVNADQIQATYNDGILEVHIPLPPEEQAQGRNIPIA